MPPLTKTEWCTYEVNSGEIITGLITQTEAVGCAALHNTANDNQDWHYCQHEIIFINELPIPPSSYETQVLGLILPNKVDPLPEYKPYPS